MANKSKGKNAAVVEADDELELIEDDDETPAKSSSKGKSKAAAKESPAPKAESTGMGASWLAEYVNEQLDTNYTAAQVRVVLRKMAQDGDLEREVGTDRARYQFTGEKDPVVKAVLKRMRAGEADTAKKERIEAARSGKKSDGDEAAKPAAAKRRKDKDAEETETPSRPAARRRRKSED